jgi:aldehyde:ferredoxin oxidoreductase
MTNQSLKNSLLLCNFASLPDSYFNPPEMDVRIFESESFSSVTGFDQDVDELWRAGERIWNLRRAVMVKREDRSRERDTYADGFFDSPWTDIQDRDNVYTAYIDRAKFEALKDRYYELAGWDLKTGQPTRAKLEELDMKDVADDLETLAKLPQSRGG